MAKHNSPRVPARRVSFCSRSHFYATPRAAPRYCWSQRTSTSYLSDGIHPQRPFPPSFLHPPPPHLLCTTTATAHTTAWTRYQACADGARRAVGVGFGPGDATVATEAAPSLRLLFYTYADDPPYFSHSRLRLPKREHTTRATI